MGPALRTFIASVPDNSTIVFPAGTYLCKAQCIQLRDRRGLTFSGYGATIRNTARGTSPDYSAFHLLSNNHNLKILGFKLQGSNPDAATEQAYHQGAEHSEGVAMYNGNTDIVMADLHVTEQWGHCLYIASSLTAAVNERITFRDSICERTGVMGLVVASGRDITFNRNTIRDIALYPIDIEDGKAGQPVDGVIIRDNVIDRWSWNEYYLCHAIVGASSEGLSPFRGIIIERNVLRGGDQASPSGGCPTGAGVISFYGSDQKSNFQVRDNVFELPQAQRKGLGVRMTNLNGGTIAGNSMPGQTVQCNVCSGVSYD